MIARVSPHSESAIPAAKLTLSSPSSLIEYGYYFAMFYAVMSGALGLSVGLLGSAILALLSAACLLQPGSQVMTVFRLVSLSGGCALSYILIQVVVHNQPLGEDAVRSFVAWLFSMVIVQTVAFRKDFLHRFAIVTLLLGLAMLPYVTINIHTKAYQRIGLDSAVGFSNPNAFAAWYGFCAVYFTILGYVTRRDASRILSWLIAIGCMFVVTLTISRSALSAIAIAVLLGSRHVLKRGFLPMLLLACLAWLVIELGFFDHAVRVYGLRLTEETGRFLVWPLIVDRILDSPLLGVGEDDTGAVIYTGEFITPHNGFLWLALASGIVPCVLFVLYWLNAALSVFRASGKNSPDAAFHMPLLAYTFVIMSLGNVDFMAPWAIVSLAIAMTAGVRQQAPETVSPRPRAR